MSALERLAEAILDNRVSLEKVPGGHKILVAPPRPRPVLPVQAPRRRGPIAFCSIPDCYCDGDSHP